MTTDDALKARKPRVSGLTLILVATAVAGVASYVIAWLVPRQIGFANYAVFAVFWSFIYLIVGALGGIQQEVARGTRPVDPPAEVSPNRARNFAVATAAIVFVMVAASAPAWLGAIFPAQGWSMVLPLAVGGASYVLVGVLAGSVFGISRWYSIALMIVLDAILRLAIIAVALSFTHDVVVLAWCVVIPFPLAIAAAWPFIRRPIVGRTQLDVGPKQLIRNVSHTVVAAASTGVMVSGFPLLLSLTSPAEPKQVVGLYILCITLTRAPLIVILMSLQSYLVVTFRDDIEQFGERFLRVIGLIVGAGFVLALAAWFAGPTVFAWLFPGELVPQDWLLALLVASSAFVGCMSVSGSALLARGGHFAYSLGWVVAALATIAIILFPLGFSTRTVAALIIGPAAGIVVHGISLIRRRRSGMVVKG